MTVAQLVRYLAALAFSMFVSWTGWVISDLLGVPVWLGVGIWLSTFVYLYLEYVQSLNDRLARLSKKAAEEARDARAAALGAWARGAGAAGI